jgi:hypothetical protein
MSLNAMHLPSALKRSALSLLVAAGLLSGMGAGVAAADSPGVPNLNWVAVGDTDATVVWTNTANEGGAHPGDLASFELAYHPATSSVFTYVGAPADPYNELTNTVHTMLPQVYYDQEGTYQVTGLRTATQYCFSLRSYVYYGNALDAFTGDEPSPTFSDWSAETCATTGFTYSLENVKVTATSNVHTYAFDIVPDDGTAAQHYTGTYTVNTQTAHEDYGKAHWDFICPSDPWSYSTKLVCTPPASLTGSALTEPAGAEQVGEVAGGHAALATALAKALAAAPALNVASTGLGRPDTLATIAEQGVTPSKPDLAAVAIGGYTTISNGDNAVYTATIKNNGAAATGDVELTIGFAGGLQTWDTVVQSIGLTCVDGPNAASFVCKGGTLAAGQQATVTFQAHASSAGQATITVALNPTRVVDESDLSNNNASYIVTVTK